MAACCSKILYKYRSSLAVSKVSNDNVHYRGVRVKVKVVSLNLEYLVLTSSSLQSFLNFSQKWWPHWSHLL